MVPTASCRWLRLPLVLVVALGAVRGLRILDTDDSDGVPVSARKVWKRSALFSDAANWEDGAVPCTGDRIVFPRDLRGGQAYVGGGPEMNAPVEVREMELPWNGAVVLPISGSLVVGGEESRTRACPGKDARWRVTKRPAWLDPANWGPAQPPDDAKDLEAVPHLERVPCGQDVAVFPTEAFQVELPDFPVRVGAIMVAKSQVTNSERFLLILFLKYHFIPTLAWDKTAYEVLQVMADGPGDLPTLPQQCGLGTHQSLGEHQSEEVARMAADELHQAVCSYVTCPVPACARPVRPHLHCCYVCGAVVELRRPALGAEAMPDVRALVRAEALAYESRWGAAAGPAVHVGRVPSVTGASADDLDQIVLLGDNAEDLAGILVSRIREKLGLTTTLLASGALMAPATVGSVLGLLVGTLLLVLVVLAVLVYHQDRTLPLPSRLSDVLGEKQSSFLFAKFENVPGEDGRGGAVVSVVKQPQGVRSARGSWSARSFRNPLYEQEPGEDDAPLPLQVTSRGVAHENPLFSELQARVNGHHADDLGDSVDLLDQDEKPAVPPASVLEPEDPTLGVKLVDIAL